MEQHQKKYIKPGELLFANRNNSAGSTPPNDHMSETKTPGALQDNTTLTGAAEGSKHVSSIRDPRLDQPVYARLLHSRDANGETSTPRVSQYNNFILPDILEGTIKVTSTPDQAPESAQIFDDTTTSLSLIHI